MESDAIRSECLIPPEARVIYPLTGDILHLLHEDVAPSNTLKPTTISVLNDAILRSNVIWQMGHAAVLQISSTIALKTDSDLDIGHIATLTHIHHHAPSLPIPRTLGVLTAENPRRSYHFMTYFPGKSLEYHWADMSESHKKSVQAQLEAIPFESCERCQHRHVRKVVSHGAAASQGDVRM